MILGSLRRLWRYPTYTGAVIGNLALGLGATTAVAAIVHSVLLRPLPYPQPDRLVVIEHEMPGIESQGQPTHFGAFQGQALHYAERSKLLESIGVFGTFDAALSGTGEAESVRAGYASRGFFEALELRPLAGRMRLENDEQDHGAVLLSAARWARRHGSDPTVIDSALRVDGAESRITGVLETLGPFPADRPEIWTLRSERQIRETPQLLVDGLLARLSDDASVESLSRELNALIRELPESVPDAFVRRAVEEGGLSVRITPLEQVVTGGVARSLWLLLAVAGLVLGAAWVNAANLHLLHSAARRRDLAMRRALGAGRMDLLRQELATTSILAAIAGLVGLALATLVLWWARDVASPHLPISDLGLDAFAFATALTLSFLSALWLATVGGLSNASTTTVLSHASDPTGGPSGAKRRHALAAVQLAASFVLLIVAALLVRSFFALNDVEHGFEADSVLTFRVPFPAQEVIEAGGTGRALPFYDQLAERLAAAPAIESVGYAKCSPLSIACGLEGMTLIRADQPARPEQRPDLFGILQVGPGFLETLSVQLIRGRFLNQMDHEQRAQSIVLSQSAARALWGTEDPIGRQLTTPDFPDWPAFSVVGVVGDTRFTDLRSQPEPIVYLPALLAAQTYEPWVITFAIRAELPLPQLVQQIRSEIGELRADIPIAQVESMPQALARHTATLRFATLLLAGSALITLILGATGVYSVIAFAVSLRSREFAIRLAIGADRPDLRNLVYAQARSILTLGLSAGLAFAWLASHWLEAAVYAVSPRDPATYLGACILLIATVLLACYPSARAAASTEPAQVLRAQ